MGSKKKTTTSSTNQYQYYTPPPSPHLDAANAMIDNIDYQTPIRQNYGRQINDISESGNDIFGSNTTPEVSDKIRKGRLFSARTQFGEDMTGAVQAENADKISGKLSVAQGYAPQLAQSGGTQVTTQPGPGLLGSILSGVGTGVKVASMF